MIFKHCRVNFSGAGYSVTSAAVISTTDVNFVDDLSNPTRSSLTGLSSKIATGTRQLVATSIFLIDRLKQNNCSTSQRYEAISTE
jgi:hypothetical protein